MQKIWNIAKNLNLNLQPKFWTKEEFDLFVEAVTKVEWVRGLITQEEYGLILAIVTNDFYAKKS